MATFNATFAFRTTTVEQEGKKRKGGMTEAELLALVAQGKAEKLEEAGKVAFKRKPVTLALQQPEFIDENTDPLVAELVLGAVKDFVKTCFVDPMLEIGDHTWEAIKLWRDENGRSAAESGPEFSDEDAATCGNIFVEYWKNLGKDAVGQLFAELCKEKCSWASVKKLCTPKGKQITLEIVAKYRDKFQEMADGLKEHAPAESDLLQHLANVLQGHADKRFVQEDAASAW